MAPLRSSDFISSLPSEYSDQGRGRMREFDYQQIILLAIAWVTSAGSGLAHHITALSRE